ncbi:hypothetical protein TRM7557_00427 [Tritonibacter multivorans]|uniref:Hedgehog/Intein (Hint) domain-containing protein n=1 Tax=Tritonibacter multivorans TaxID=928856 RepID=A0A0P1G1B6_9RHOB|nr:Hint domain-containing protein [Tritonibacter multivorans]MDA7419465.1 Hint domain-containing protein [Tritonibacter multivorans]CUH75519.1 hypothetical protein TRM7557_00427 [Tritonibacter multivorans]SFC66227.1 Hint domain-containing protein [Tritonibacter multivorans]
MPTQIVDAIYLGITAELDTNETNWTVEQASTLLGTTFGGLGDPLWDKIGEVELEDADNDNKTRSNDNGQLGEDLTYGGTGSALDSALIYNATVHFTDGSSTTTTLVLAQDELGRLFVMPPTGGPGVLDDGYIRSITIDSLYDDDFVGLTTPREAEAFLVCFAEGTNIKTPQGETPVEVLRPGDLVATLDHGAQPVIWVGSRCVTAQGREAPVVIANGALGEGSPRAPLSVSRQHRVVIESTIAERMFGARQVLVAAKDLLDLPGVTQAGTGQTLTYWHILLPRHEILWAEDAAVESFLPTPLSLRALHEGDRQTIAQKITQLAPYEMARAQINGARARKCVARHLRNQKPLVGQGLTLLIPA